MLCEILESITTKRGTLHPGQIIEIPNSVVTQLGAKVKLVDLQRIIANTAMEIDQAAPGQWDGWRQSLTLDQRRRIGDHLALAEAACLSGDRPVMVAALAEYKALCLSLAPTVKRSLSVDTADKLTAG